ncbi:MAG TPA: CaiB/BaiF CoA-transferase family protein [Burkholderiaceae bacterium]|jgi:crotonobetainyl-CoA:carnitine CoA-transferase CaiB-like acyl-CoA transferase
MSSPRSGPLAGLKVVEFAGIGPAPMAAMLLADQGATVLRIERTEAVELGMKRELRHDLLQRGREPLALDLKSTAGRAAAMEIVAGADALIEGFRPGVMERLGLGPDACLARNPRLVYGRMTGWGQHGPLAQAAGHDVNYIALTGALYGIGRQGQPPTIPMNLVGDFGGGSLYLAFGLMAALFEAGRSGRGQVVDAGIVDGALSMLTMQYGSLAAGLVSTERGSNVGDGGAPFYNVYECADGRWVSVAAVETRFFQELLRRLDIPEADHPDRWDRSRWPQLHELLTARFKTGTRDEWSVLLEGSDACFAPVLAMDEVAAHPHMAERGAIVEVDGVPQPAPAPRFSRTPAGPVRAPRTADRADALATLSSWFGAERFATLQADGLLDGVHGTRAA